MKSNRTMIGLAILLLLLLGFVGLKQFWPKQQADKTEYMNKWKGIDKDSLTEILVKQEENSLTLTKTGSAWKVGDYPANETMVDDLLQNMLLPASVSVVSQNADRHDAFGIASTSASLTFQAGNAVQTVRIGNAGSGGRYISFGDEANVYLVPAVTGMIDSTKVDDWIDKTLTNISAADIKKISIEGNGATTTLTQIDGKWQVNDRPEIIDPTLFTALTSTLESFIVQGLVAEDEEGSYPKIPMLKVVVETQNGTDVTLHFYQGKGDTSLVDVSDRPGKYMISTTTLDNFTVNPKDLKILPSPTPTGK